jgi:hypothetical protein
MSRIGVLAHEAIEALREGRADSAAEKLAAIATLADSPPEPVDVEAGGRLLAEIACKLAAANRAAYWGDAYKQDDSAGAFVALKASEDARALLRHCTTAAALDALKGGGA